ncbi:DUF982 domain-containing protein [Mesorhizobium sp. M0586]|uniref:DUF982 domain-containing protein n=1 Tax=unclassified Mesorhizobium TaxID=325217 RepID=UPI0033394E1A
MSTVSRGHLRSWPQRGPLWRKAVEACVAALAGEAPPESVREPFESAAREAGKLRRAI